MKLKPILLVLCLLLSGLAAPAYSQIIMIEAEDYIDSFDIALDSIQVVVGFGCSGGYYVMGLDYPDEWTEYNVGIDSLGAYSASLLCRGDIGVPYHLQLVSEVPGEDPEVIDFTFTGQGYG
ncbi:MAG: hypothetical protein JSV33_09315 [bacterium]|nr:MAG: hypothetical protein JSV33_09315 [bacterium]